VTGQTETARVGQALAVEEQEVRRGLEFLNRRQGDRAFAEAEQAGHVRESDAPADDDLFDGFQVRQAEYDDAGDAGLRVAGGVGDVHAGDQGRRPGGGFEAQLPAKPTLQGDGPGGGEVPGVESVDVHGAFFARVAATRPGARV
jgi:hypothetical protein